MIPLCNIHFTWKNNHRRRRRTTSPYLQSCRHSRTRGDFRLFYAAHSSTVDIFRLRRTSYRVYFSTSGDAASHTAVAPTRLGKFLRFSPLTIIQSRVRRMNFRGFAASLPRKKCPPVARASIRIWWNPIKT